MTRVRQSAPQKLVPAARKKTAKRAAKHSAAKKVAAAVAPYHHGALREALLAAAERVLERDGLPGLTLRAAAREAGVSHAAPTHHFGDLTGLVSELAAIGFSHFNAAMASAAEIEGPPLAKAAARARAYLAYARAHPGMYLLMFRTERLDMTRPALRDAANAAFAGIAGTIGSIRGETVPEQALSLNQAAEIVGAWSLVHGYTMLLIDGRLTNIIERLPAGTDAEVLFGAMLMSMARPPA
jgi:AcrR family transcriptional regulator